MARVRIVVDEVRCDGCGVCIPACSQSALQLVDGKARVVDEACDGLERCIGVCPVGALRIVPEPV